MKRAILVLLSILMIALAGCGEGTNTAGAARKDTDDKQSKCSSTC
ncbi:hypothetical protein [uncultured Mitsuokella sp.]|nr:hypothetical protein [uncultured Mitsuokella sp.]